MRVFISILCLFTIVNYSSTSGTVEDKLVPQTKTWSERLGAELWHFGKFVTRKNSVLERYKTADVVIKEGDTLVKEIALKIKTMMDEKVRAVERIMDTAANLALSSSDDVDMEFPYINAKKLINNLTHPKTDDDEEEPQVESIQYQEKAKHEESFKDIDKEDYPEDEAPLEGNGKDVIQVTDEEADAAQASQQEAHQPPPMDKTRLNLTENCNFFDIPVNMEHSAVHVPSNVFDRSKDVIQGIRWSEDLDRIFKDNYKEDPSLSWQYFGSSTGFMRQFPAMIWHQEPVDAFDCRTRSWFIEAASSPKDLVILVDRSGSMTGMQKEIAKHVVNNILDTLGNNDYVNIFTFSNITEPLIGCFNDTLVQANLANVRELKNNMDTFKTENIANFSEALTVAFRLLENYRIGSRNKSGAGCNQAIMLITDGVQQNFEDLFKEYNWRDLPYKPVRVFTYLIGSEVSDVREVKWMACANQGFYVHLSTFAEVREQVLLYISVMARPMVLWGQPPIPTWSPVYADVTDPKLTNWLWTQRQRRDQRDRFLSHRTHPHRHTTETDKKLVHQQKMQSEDHYGDLQLYTLMTSVSMPVYDKRQNATRIANLLGVAGTDVPIAYIQQLMMPHLLGANSYAFITTNNGYVLIHPDLRPVFQGILKPAFNRVDMAEVELPDDELDPRVFNRSLIAMRKDIVYQRKDKKVLNMKFHLDDMKRVMKGKRFYHYLGIEKTPFTLVVSLPDRYGTSRLQHPIHEDIHRLVLNHIDLLKNFNGSKWRIHPEWIYCRYLSGNVKFNSSEEELRDFLSRMQHEHWKWSHKNTSCDRSLVNALVYDAKSTNFFDTNISTADAEKKGHEFLRRFGVTIAFISTHSGLTRWQDFPQNAMPNEENKTRVHFSEVHTKAIDEVWYKRAVDHYFIEEDSFVYSVPFDVGSEPDTLITASHAVFLKGKDNRKTPVAVVGYQFYQSAFASLFKNISNNTCENANYLCYFLDNNAYIVLGEDLDETGHWFGDHQPGMMKMLVDERVFESVLIYDYQAVCFPEEEDKSFANPITTPLKHMTNLLQWAIGTLFYFFHIASGNSIDYESTSEPTIASNQPPTKQNEKEFDRSILITKTSPTPCDERRWLYELIYHKNALASPYNKKMRKDKPFIVQRVQNSNLIFLLIHTTGYKLDEELFETPHPEEIDYNMTLACRIREDDLWRHRYAKCINRHINESEIELCGSSSFLAVPTKLALINLTSLLLILYFRV